MEKTSLPITQFSARDLSLGVQGADVIKISIEAGQWVGGCWLDLREKECSKMGNGWVVAKLRRQLNILV